MAEARTAGVGSRRHPLVCDVEIRHVADSKLQK